MRNRTWAGILAGLLAVCLGLSLWLLRPGEDAQKIEVWSDGKLQYTLSLREDQTLVIRSREGVNTVTIQGGKVAVTEADCPDQICMARGYCSSGPQIVCLPNRLVIRFLAPQEVDSVVG